MTHVVINGSSFQESDAEQPKKSFSEVKRRTSEPKSSLIHFWFFSRLLKHAVVYPLLKKPNFLIILPF